MKLNQMMNKVPKIGGERPITNISAEQEQLKVLGKLGDKIKVIIDTLEDYLETNGYENLVDGCAKKLQSAIREAELDNKEVPLVWQVFEQRFKDKMSKVSPEEQDKGWQFNYYAPIWNLMSQWHNIALQNTKFGNFYGQDFSNDTTEEAGETEEA